MYPLPYLGHEKARLQIRPAGSGTCHQRRKNTSMATPQEKPPQGHLPRPNHPLRFSRLQYAAAQDEFPGGAVPALRAAESWAYTATASALSLRQQAIIKAGHRIAQPQFPAPPAQCELNQLDRVLFGLTIQL